jgi:hypothetical protein
MLSQSSRSAFPQVIQFWASERQETRPELLLSAIQNVALVLRDDKGEARDLGREVTQFDAPKIGEGNFGAKVRFTAPPVDLGLDLPHLLVGNDEEVARAAGRIENPDLRHALAQVEQRAGIVARLLQVSRAGHRETAD